MISASKSALSLNNLKILRPKVTKNITNLHKKFCEFPPWIERTYCKLALTKRGRPPKKAGTASSMMLWLFTKLRLASGKVVESREQRPGLGLGSLIFGTGSQLEFVDTCNQFKLELKYRSQLPDITIRSSFLQKVNGRWNCA